MEITEPIYEGVVETSHKKYNRSNDNHAGNIKQNIGEANSSKNYSDMLKSAGKRKQGCVYHMRDILKLTCLIHGPDNLSDGFKGLNYVGSNYTKGSPTK